MDPVKILRKITVKTAAKDFLEKTRGKAASKAACPEDLKAWLKWTAICTDPQANPSKIKGTKPTRNRHQSQIENFQERVKNLKRLILKPNRNPKSPQLLLKSQSLIQDCYRRKIFQKNRDQMSKPEPQMISKIQRRRSNRIARARVEGFRLNHPDQTLALKRRRNFP